MTDYYDTILIVMPVSLFGIAGMLAAVGYSVTVGASFGALVAATVMGHAMFINAPGSDVSPTEASAERDAPELSTG